MKVSTIFWGIVFLLLGVLALLHNLEVIELDWHTVFRLWPALLVVWGISLLAGKRGPRWPLAIALIVLMLLMAVGALVFEWTEFRGDFVFDDPSYRRITEPMDPSIERAVFSFEAGAGRFTIEEPTDQLVETEVQTSFGRYVLDRYRSDAKEHVALQLRGDPPTFRLGRIRNRADVRLNAHPVWDFDVDVGAANIDFDLRPYKVSNVRIEGGAAKMVIRLGDRSERTSVRIDAGATSIRIEVPSSSGCEVRADTKLTRRSLKGFERLGGGLYRTPGFENTDRKILIEVDAGVSSLRITRY